jgi:hypothetical protein
MISWCCVGGVSTFAYFIGLHEPSGVRQLLARPKDSINYALVFLGAPMTHRAFDCVPSGRRCPTVIADARLRGGILLVLLAVATVVVVRRRCIGGRPLFAIASFGVLSALIASLGRAGFGASQALESRYTSISLMAWIGLVLLVALIFTSPRRDRASRRRVVSFGSQPWIALTVCTVLGFGYMAMTANWELWFKGRHDGLLQARANLLKPDATDAELRPNNDPNAIRVLSAGLRRQALTAFRGVDSNKQSRGSTAPKPPLFLAPSPLRFESRVAGANGPPVAEECLLPKVSKKLTAFRNRPLVERLQLRDARRNETSCRSVANAIDSSRPRATIVCAPPS